MPFETESVNSHGVSVNVSPQASRQLQRQAERENTKIAAAPPKKMSRLQRTYRALEAQGLEWALRTLPPREKFLPSIFFKGGIRMGQTGWQRHNALSLEQLKAAASVRDVGSAIMGDAVGVFDWDGEDPQLTALAHRVIKRGYGETCKRGRGNSLRFAATCSGRG